MRKTVSLGQAVVASEAVLPPRVQEALGELVGVAREGLLALSVGVGLAVFAELMEEEVDEVVGPKGRHDLERTAVRHGHESGEVTLGGRRLAVERPRVRSVGRTVHGRARERLRALAADLEHSHPGAAGSLREGLEETLTLTRLGISGSLKRTLESTNPCESMIECVRRTSRNVKRWSSGEMAMRWTAAGMLEAEKQFRRIIGYRDLAKLAIAIEHDLAPTTLPSPIHEAAIFIPA